MHAYPNIFWCIAAELDIFDTLEKNPKERGKMSLFRPAFLSVLALSLVLFVPACSSAPAPSSSQTQTSPASQGAASNETAQSSSSTASKRVDHGSYSTEEMYVDNNGARIYGVAYIPHTQEAKRPMVLYSHGLGGSHEGGTDYARHLAENGYGAFVFDFRGGTAGGNKSDGDTTQMSVLTEASDLEAVLHAARSWDYVDPSRIVLLGASQGGAVSALVAGRHESEVAGAILMFPAMTIGNFFRNRFGSIDGAPEVVEMSGGWLKLGKRYVEDIWDVDFYGEIAEFKKPMLILHGDADDTVPLSVSERLHALIPQSEYMIVPGGGHEFNGEYFDIAIEYMLDFMRRTFR